MGEIVDMQDLQDIIAVTAVGHGRLAGMGTQGAYDLSVENTLGKVLYVLGTVHKPDGTETKVTLTLVLPDDALFMMVKNVALIADARGGLIKHRFVAAARQFLNRL